MRVHNGLLGLNRENMYKACLSWGRLIGWKVLVYGWRGIVGGGFYMGSLELLYTACARQFLTVFASSGAVFQTQQRV